MASRLQKKMAGAALSTVAFGASYGVMYILWARFEPGYFYTSLGVYSVLLVASLLLLGRREPVAQERDAPVEHLRPRQEERLARIPSSLLSNDGLPIQVEKALGMPLSSSTPAPAEAPVGFQMRGFTLYERASPTGVQRFFSRTKPVGRAEPIALPASHEAKWDAKKKRPYLQPLQQSEHEPEEIVVKRPAGSLATKPSEPQAPAARERLCAAFTSPGIMCTKPARGEAMYCPRHVTYRSDSLQQGLVVRHDSPGRPQKSFKHSVADVEVRVARPQAKPLRIKASQVKVEIARPSNAPSRKGKRVTPAEKALPALKNPADAAFEVRLAKPNAQPLRAKTASPAATVRTPKPDAKPLRLKPPREPVIKPAASLAAAKPFRLRKQEDFDVTTVRGPLAAPADRTVACRAVLRNKQRCGKPARGGAEYCTQHKTFQPKFEAVVVRDTRARSALNVGDLDVPSRPRSR